MFLALSQANSLPLLDAALFYASTGYVVFPCTPGAKTPLLSDSWPAIATRDPGQIRAWWTQFPTANIGLPMGGNCHVIDVDQKEGEDGWRSYLALGGQQSPPWPHQFTPSGGRHLHVRGDYAFSNFSKRGPYGGLDCRSARGYILGAPSVVNGVAYRWVDGDLDAPLPEPLKDAYERFSEGALARSLETFPMVDPAEISDGDAERLIDLLGADHARFLRTGEGSLSNRSKDAYQACLRAFSVGWDLPTMAAIGPQTVLATFGAEHPHYAHDPWKWCWKYTVKAAWLRAKKNSPRDVDLLDACGESPPPNAEETAGGSVTQPLDTYQLLSAKAESLPADSYDPLRDFLQETLLAGISVSRQQALWRSARKASGYSLDIIRQIVDELRDERRETSDQEDALDEIYVQDQAKVYNQLSGTLISKEAYLTEKARGVGGDRGEAELLWLTGGRARCRVVESLIYDPGLPPGVTTTGRGVGVYNTYRPSDVRPVPGDVGPWLQLLDALSLEDGEPAKGMLLDRLAWAIQHPGVKFNHGVILGGEAGIGKDSFLAPWLDCVGRHNVVIIHGQELASDFNSWAKAKVVLVNEINWGTHADRHRVSELLKPALAAPPETLRVNEKNLRPYSVPNRLQMFGFTNHRIPIHADPDERRYLMLWCGLELGEHADAWSAWFAQYWQWLRVGGTEAVMAYLLERDLSHFQPGARPPVTGWLEQIIMHATDDLQPWLLEQIKRGEGVFEANVVDARAIMQVIDSGVQGYMIHGHVSPQRLGAALYAIGAKNIRVGKKRIRAWRIREDGGPTAEFEKANQARRVVQIAEAKERRWKNTTHANKRKAGLSIYDDKLSESLIEMLEPEEARLMPWEVQGDR